MYVIDQRADQPFPQFREYGDANFVGTGEHVEFTLPITPSFVGESMLVVVVLVSDSKFHRGTNYDDIAVFPFSVSPPEDE